MGTGDDAERDPVDDDDDPNTTDDDEVATTDQFEVTPAERERDWNLACQIVAGLFAGLLAAYGVGPGVIGATFAPVLASIMTSFRRIGQRRVEHSAETLLHAADAAELPLDEFFGRAVSDDRHHELFTRTLTIAQDTALRKKRQALGHALAAGVMGDDAAIDEELLFIRAVEDIDTPHIRLLSRVASAHAQPPGWSALRIIQADPGLANGVGALLGTLELHGLIAATAPPITRGPNAGQTFYNITGQGQKFLDRLAEDAVDLQGRSGVQPDIRR